MFESVDRIACWGKLEGAEQFTGSALLSNVLWGWRRRLFDLTCAREFIACVHRQLFIEVIGVGIMDKLESRTNRLNAMTRSEIMPASMLKASSVKELQSMRTNEAAGKRLAIDIESLSRQETRKIEGVVAEQKRAVRDIKGVRARKTSSVEEWFEMYRRRTDKEKETERRKIKDQMGLLRRRTLEAWKHTGYPPRSYDEERRGYLLSQSSNSFSPSAFPSSFSQPGQSRPTTGGLPYHQMVRRPYSTNTARTFCEDDELEHTASSRFPHI